MKARSEYKELTEKKTELENQLRQCIGESLGIAQLATWKPTVNRKVFDKKRFIKDEPKLYKKYTTEQPGNRVLRIMEPKDDDSN